MFSLSYILSVTYHASKILQKVDQDILSAYELMKDIIKNLEDKRFNSQNSFNSIYKECLCLMEKLEIEIKTPRVISGKQKYRPNPDTASNCEDCYRISTFIPLLVNILEDLRNRFFSSDSSTLQSLMQLIPSYNASINNQQCDEILNEVMKHFSFFKNINQATFKSELELWFKRWNRLLLEGSHSSN